MQSDPIGMEGGINTYAYALLAPTMLADPLGLDPFWCTVSLDNAYRAAGLGTCRSRKEPPEPQLTCTQKCDQLLAKCRKLVDWYPWATRIAGGFFGGGIGAGFKGVSGAAIGSAFGATGPQIGEGVTGMSQGGLYKGCDAGYAKCSKACECTSN